MLVFENAVQYINDVLCIADTYNSVRLGELLGSFLLISLNETACDDYFL